jgi:hypothetical protein
MMKVFQNLNLTAMNRKLNPLTLGLARDRVGSDGSHAVTLFINQIQSLVCRVIHAGERGLATIYYI